MGEDVKMINTEYIVHITQYLNVEDQYFLHPKLTLTLPLSVRITVTPAIFQSHFYRYLFYFILFVFRIQTQLTYPMATFI